MKKKSNSSIVNDPKKICLVIRSGIKIYPVNIKGLWYIEVDVNGKLVRYPKSVSNSDINDAVSKTLLYYYNKIVEKKLENLYLARGDLVIHESGFVLRYLGQEKQKFSFELVNIDGVVIPDKKNEFGIVVEKSKRSYTIETVVTFKKKK